MSKKKILEHSNDKAWGLNKKRTMKGVAKEIPAN